MYASRQLARRGIASDEGAWRGQGPYLLGDTDGSARRILAPRRAPGLGSLTSIIGGLIGGAVGGPAGAAIGTSAGSSLSAFTGNQDAQRQQRVNWMLQAAQQGSTLAAAIIYGGPANTASHEQGMWASAWQQIPPAIQQAAIAAYPTGAWPVGADFNMTTDRQAIVTQLQQLGVRATTGNPTSPTPSGLPTTPIPGTGLTPTTPTLGFTLPGMTTTAGYNWLPVALIGGAAIIALTSGKKGRR